MGELLRIVNQIQGTAITGCLTFLFLLAFIRVESQQDDSQFWMNYALKTPVNENFSWGGDAGMRGLGSSFDWNQLLIRPAANYKFNDTFGLSGALAWFGTFNNGTHNISEFRVHQDFNARWPDLNALYFFYRVRLEQRFFFYRRDVPNDFKIRLRGLIGVQTKDLTWFGAKRPIYFQSLLEGFNTINEDEALELFINNSRLHLAFGHRISKKFRYELHYIWQGSSFLFENGLDTAQNILRVRLFHTI